MKFDYIAGTVRHSEWLDVFTEMIKNGYNLQHYSTTTFNNIIHHSYVFFKQAK